MCTGYIIYFNYYNIILCTILRRNAERTRGNNNSRVKNARLSRDGIPIRRIRFVRSVLVWKSVGPPSMRAEFRSRLQRMDGFRSFGRNSKIAYRLGEFYIIRLTSILYRHIILAKYENPKSNNNTSMYTYSVSATNGGFGGLSPKIIHDSLLEKYNCFL